MRKFFQTGIDVEIVRLDTTVIKVSGQIDLSNVEGMRSAIEEVISESLPELVIDLSSTDYIDSSGIATIMAARHNLVDLGGMLVLVTSNPNVRRSLDLLRLDMIPGISLCEDMATAAQILSKRRGEH